MEKSQFLTLRFLALNLIENRLSHIKNRSVKFDKRDRLRSQTPSFITAFD